MDYEKKYKGLAGKIKKAYLYAQTDSTKAVLEGIMPELKESDDERIRKELIDAIQGLWDNDALPMPLSVKRKDAWLAWLEKQGETPCDKCKKEQPSHSCQDITALGRCAIEKQEVTCTHEVEVGNGNIKTLVTEKIPADKVEPKFHEGDWLCENEPNNYARFIQILEIVNVQGKDRYIISRDIHKDEDVVEFGFVEKYYHKFDIKDAKDGDILSTPIDVLIFKNHLPKNGGVSYCNYTFDSGWSQFNYNENNNWYFGKEAIIHPATKEQRDLLFATMKEACYEWDAEKKELNKIEDNSKNCKQQIMSEITDLVTDYIRQKPTWSEEDEEMFAEAISVLLASSCSYDDIEKVSVWLRTIKQRMEG